MKFLTSSHSRRRKIKKIRLLPMVMLSCLQWRRTWNTRKKIKVGRIDNSGGGDLGLVYEELQIKGKTEESKCSYCNCVDEDEGEKDEDTSEATPFTVLYKVIHMYMHACTVV